MKVKKEQDLAKQLLKDEITVDEFLNEDKNSWKRIVVQW